MGDLLVQLEDHTGSRRVVTATGKDYADDMNLLARMRAHAELYGWVVVKVKRNGRTFKEEES